MQGNGMDKGRQDATSLVVKKMAEMMVVNPKTEMVFGVDSTTPKESRGVNHTSYARLLLPFKDHPEFDRDPEYVVHLTHLQ